ncbi:acyl-CoA desaturase [Nakamurella sp. A5-74]|uniref:Acyl-CoA desaturase n=1 Tax=Nakamurella sp. A5-74 TaxID=3158264 RepID=A0AAU8DMZ6_9ACTN
MTLTIEPTDRRSGKPGAATSTTEYSQVLQAVQSQGLLERRYGYYAIKTALLFLALAGVWVAFSFLGTNWAQLGIAVALAIVITQVIFLGHDAAHKQIFKSRKANDRVAMVLGTVIAGISLSWWNAKHSKHHATPNQIGKDPDIEPSIVHFYTAEKPIRSRIALFMHAHQGWWFFPILVVESLNLQVQSVIWLFGKRDVRKYRVELVLMMARIIALPVALFVFLPAGMATLFFLVHTATIGVYLGASFAVSHVGMPVIPATEKMSFFDRQVRSSRNVLGGRIASGLMGGLNFQIEHHLFPSMPRPNLRKAVPIIREHCAAKDVKYHEVPIYTAWSIVVKHLNRVGMAGRDLYGCPTASVLR